METISRKVKCLRHGCFVEANQDIFHPLDKVGPNPSRIAIFIEPLQPPMLETPDHQSIL
jgi:hypothetical protein